MALLGLEGTLGQSMVNSEDSAYAAGLQPRCGGQGAGGAGGPGLHQPRHAEAQTQLRPALMSTLRTARRSYSGLQASPRSAARQKGTETETQAERHKRRPWGPERKDARVAGRHTVWLWGQTPVSHGPGLGHPGELAALHLATPPGPFSFL